MRPCIHTPELASKRGRIGFRVPAATASQSPGMQQLPQAEKQKRAAEKVSEARKPKSRRPKQAQEAAQAETEPCRRQREKGFKAQEAAALGPHGSCSSEVEKGTTQKMTILQNCVRQNREEVLENLSASVCDTQPEIHENYRINGEDIFFPRVGVVVDALMDNGVLAKL
ncbi:V-type proton ATPase subunit G 1-like [Perognathus longimembris pacificus]|uniref:V-type proton ATPase subunit G 1-like n=1 Tax=Perognathus longimembris pacificus TaxID=214514 RepID=UPI002018E485|nr:V-type proton ATPase subunit G 1-like [Perognathus longimembris pacificus]